MSENLILKTESLEPLFSAWEEALIEPQPSKKALAEWIETMGGALDSRESFWEIAI